MYSTHLQGGLGKLEGVASPLCSLQALQAGEATEGEMTIKRTNVTHFLKHLDTFEEHL